MHGTINQISKRRISSLNRVPRKPIVKVFFILCAIFCLIWASAGNYRVWWIFRLKCEGIFHFKLRVTYCRWAIHNPPRQVRATDCWFTLPHPTSHTRKIDEWRPHPVPRRFSNLQEKQREGEDFNFTNSNPWLGPLTLPSMLIRWW